MPRVVTAGLPMRMPEATSGGFSSYGMVFLLTVMPAVSRALSITLPVVPAAATSSRKTWLSVPPETIRWPRPTRLSASRAALATTAFW